MFINPSFLYILTWTMGLSLYTLYYSNIFIQLSPLMFNYIVASMVAVFFGWLVSAAAWFNFVEWKNFNRHNVLLNGFNTSAERKIKYLLYGWLFLSLAELLYFRDLPILALFGLSAMSYHDYGVPSLHGFLNAIMLSLSMYALYKFILYNKYKYFVHFLFFAMVPLLSMNRGGFVSLLLQGLFVFLVFKRVKFTFYVKLFFVIVMIMFLFAWLGEARNVGGGADVYDAFQISDNYPGWMPRSFIWFYMYITASINNLQNTILLYMDFNFSPDTVLYSLLPSVIRDTIPAPQTIELVADAFNVSSFMPNYLSAFGVFGSLIFYFFASLFPMYIYYMYLHTGKLEYGFTLVILLHSIVLSIFSEFFFIQVYMFQMVLQFLIFRKIKISGTKHV